MSSTAVPAPGALRAVFTLFRPHRARLIAAQFAFIIKNSPVWAIPIITADLINVVSAPELYTIRRIWIDAAILAGLIIQNVGSHVVYVRLISETVRALEAELRQQLVRRIQQLSIGFIERKSSGALQSKLMRDVDQIHGLCQMLLTMLTSCGVSVALAIGITAAKQPSLLLFYGVAVPFAVALTRAFRPGIEQRNRDYRQHTEALSARLMEMINMLPITRAHGLEETEVSTISERLDVVKEKGLRVDMINAFFGAAWWCISQLMQILCLLIAIIMAWHKMIQPGDVVLFTGLFAMMVGSISALVDNLPALSRGIESARSIRELLDAPEIEHYAGKSQAGQIKGQFTFKNVTFTYPGIQRPALNDFTLCVEPGETIAVVGPSGSGKTTLMSLIIGFRHPNSGSILLDGRNLTDIDLRSYRRQLAVVPQQTLLFTGSIRDNITYGLPDVTEKQFQEVVRLARVDEFVPSLPHGLETNIGEHGGLLSGGQRQRIAIARAMIRNPRVIILDEATSSLDNISERYVQEAIQQLAANRTMFVVAHRLSTIRSAHRIVVLRDGLIVEVGTHEQLTERGETFARMQALQ
jgi:ATP-binding cassette, subfamily B, bacterial